MANLPTDDIGTRSSLLRARVPLFNLLGRADDVLYGVERIVVVAALLTMTLSSFLKVLADFIEKRDTMTVTFVVTFFAFFIIGRVAAAASPLLADNRLMSNITAVLWGFGALFYVWLIDSSTLTLETLSIRGVTDPAPFSYYWVVGSISSATVTNFHILVIGFILAYFELSRPRPMGEATWTLKSLARMLVIIVATGVGLWIGNKLDVGYSWAPQVSLVLLLWMAFLGASMATHEGKHLAVDAVRKLVPPHRERAFNATSQMVAGIVTAGFLYLSVTYLLKRLGEDPEPGKIPDWFKVLSIPVALGIMTLRFVGYSIGNAVGAILQVEPEPAVDITTEVQS